MSLSWLLTWALIALVAWLLASGFVKPQRFFEFPFLAGVMTLAFILPQLPGIANDPFVPADAYVKAVAMTVLCLLMLRLGWTERRTGLAVFDQTYSETRLLAVAAAMSLAGAVFYFQLSRLPSETSVGVTLSGTPVLYLFFARFLPYGLVIAALCFARRPAPFAGAIIAFDLVFYVDRIVVTGKRAETMELLLIFALALWFQRRWTVPRTAVLATLVAGTVVMTSMSDYRQITRAAAAPIWEDVSRIDFAGNFAHLLEAGGWEMRNAVQRIDHIDRTLQFDYGTFHWNRLVFNFVPAQLVGTRIKESLYLPSPAPNRDYLPLTGTTETGMVDAFESFWYFGALKFLLLAWVMSRIWGSAMAGQTTGQIVYILSIVPAMHSVSHLTDWVVQVWVHMAIFLLPVLLFAAVRAPRSPPLPRPAAVVA